MKTQHDINQKQYADKSISYLNSQVHAQGIEFKKIINLISNQQKSCILDLGCGGGHVSYQIAPFVKEVVAYDLSAEMLETVKDAANQKQLHNIRVQQGPAERLPFSDQTFDFVVSRFSAHHWQNISQAMQEIRRVLTKGGVFILIDIVGSNNPAFDTFLQSIEVIRDPSHVRDYSLAEWINLAEKAEFEVDIIEKQKLQLDFQQWVERMKTPSEAIHTIRYLQESVSDHVRSYFNIQSDGSFETEVGYFVFR